MNALLAIGTRKGLFLARSRDGGPFEVEPVRFSTIAVPSVAIDRRGGTPRLLAGIEYGHFGPSVLWSDDLGETWQEAEEPPVAFPERTGATLAKVWQLEPSLSEPGVVWAGVEPAALFRSEDGGRTYSLVEGLWNHPTRSTWQPGGGGLCLHTVIPHPTEPRRIGVAASAVGFFRSSDAGATWEGFSQGLPDEPVHASVLRDALCASDAGVFFGTRDGEVYGSRDKGETWSRIARHLPDVLTVRAAVL